MEMSYPNPNPNAPVSPYEKYPGLKPENNQPMPMNPSHENKMKMVMGDYPEMKPEMKPEMSPYSMKPVKKPVKKPMKANMGPGHAMSPYTGYPNDPAYGPHMKKKMDPMMQAPSQSLHCPPQQAPSMYDPERVNVQHVYKPVIVRHYHPMRTHIQTHYVYEHQHYYPHKITESCDERHYTVQCERPCFPKPHC